MVLSIAHSIFPYQYTAHIGAAVVAVLFLRAVSQGRSTTRERDLHGRTFLVTGGFTPLGLTLLQALAQRGAHIIALSQHPIDSPQVTVLVSLLRTTHANENIFAEQCDLYSPKDIHAFCTRFLTESDGKGKETDKRIDGIIFAHEYQHTGIPSLVRRKKSPNGSSNNNHREAMALATFLITTLLLPALLVAPVERDIRIINVVNPFYAAAAAAKSPFDPSFHISPSPSSSPILFSEGLRSLRTVIFTRHLQRIFDALPKPQVPKTEEGSSAVPVISPRTQRSNIVAVSVSPGISRADTISRFLNADWSTTEETDGQVKRSYSWFGILLYLLILPFLHLSTKSPKAAIQSVLHALFLPTPFKVLSQSTADSKDQSRSGTNSALIREEVLKPGALYAECAVVKLKVAVPVSPEPSEEPKEKKGLQEEVLQIEDDGEYGGEVAGRIVWEAYEQALKIWEKESKEN